MQLGSQRTPRQEAVRREKGKGPPNPRQTGGRVVVSGSRDPYWRIGCVLHMEIPVQDNQAIIDAETTVSGFYISGKSVFSRTCAKDPVHRFHGSSNIRGDRRGVVDFLQGLEFCL